MDGREIVPLPENHYECIAGKPMSGDVAERNGRVYAFTCVGKRLVTEEFADVAGWEMPEQQFPSKRSDVYDW